MSITDALSNLLDVYVAMVNSGDCGFWEPEKDDVVIAARAALAAAQGEGEGPTYTNWKYGFDLGFVAGTAAAAQYCMDELGGIHTKAARARAIRALRPPAAPAESEECARETSENWNQCHRCESMWPASNTEFRPMACPEYRGALSASAPAGARIAAAKIICSRLCGNTCILVQDPERPQCTDKNCRVWPVVGDALAAASINGGPSAAVGADISEGVSVSQPPPTPAGAQPSEEEIAHAIAEKVNAPGADIDEATRAVIALFRHELFE